jgi:hypothetical protein
MMYGSDSTILDFFTFWQLTRDIRWTSDVFLLCCNALQGDPLNYICEFRVKEIVARENNVTVDK